MTPWYLIVAVLVLDGLIGDPRYPFHPVRIIGRMATRLEVFLRAQFGSTIGTGAMGWLIIIGGTCLAGIALPELAAPKHFDVNAAARLDSHLYGGRLLCLVLVIEDPGCLP